MVVGSEADSSGGGGGDLQRKPNTLLDFVPFDEKQASQIGVPKKLAINLVGFRSPASRLALLDRNPY